MRYVGIRGMDDGGWDGGLVDGGINGRNVAGWAEIVGGARDKNVCGEDEVNGEIEQKSSRKKSISVTRCRYRTDWSNFWRIGTKLVKVDKG